VPEKSFGYLIFISRKTVKISAFVEEKLKFFKFQKSAPNELKLGANDLRRIRNVFDKKTFEYLGIFFEKSSLLKSQHFSMGL